MRISFAISLLCLLFTTAHAQKKLSVTSPDGQVRLNVSLSDKVYYDVESHGETLVKNGYLGMTLDKANLGANPVLKGKKVKTVNETVTPIFSSRAPISTTATHRSS